MTALQTSRKTIRSGWLDKVMQVAENGKTTQSYSYDISGQLATADYGDSRETFLWDGLALLSRNNLKYVNEPAVTGGNPILAGDKMLFDDMLGNTLGVKDGEKFSAIDRDAFGELKPGEKPNLAVNFFTGKPEIEGLGYSFLFRNYRADLGKWQTSDPLGYPDGWNNLAYVNNGVTMNIDWSGGWTEALIKSQLEKYVQNALSNFTKQFKSPRPDTDIAISANFDLSNLTISVQSTQTLLWFISWDADSKLNVDSLSVSETVKRTNPDKYCVRNEDNDSYLCMEDGKPKPGKISSISIDQTLNFSPGQITDSFVWGIAAVEIKSIKISGSISGTFQVKYESYKPE